MFPKLTNAIKLLLIFLLASFSYQLRASDTCRADISYAELSLGKFAFYSKSYCTTGLPVTYVWNFGDGDTSHAKNPVHQYKMTGDYSLSLEIFGKNGGTDQKVLIADIHAGSRCNYDFEIQKRDSVITIDFPLAEMAVYEFDFGDGIKDTLNYNEVYITHTYKQNGDYIVSFYNIYGNSCKDTVRKKVTITDPVYCSANFTTTRANDLDRTVYAEVDYFAGEDSSYYEWNFGEGNLVSGKGLKKVSHKYSASDTFDISLRTFNTGLGCSSSVTIVVKDPDFCHAGFKATNQNDFYRTVNFESDSLDFAAKDNSKYEWDFGDGGKDSGTGKYFAMHKYAADGTYKVSLKTSNTKYNCSDTSSQYVTVKRVLSPGEIYGTVSVFDTASTNVISADTAIVYLISYNEQDSTLNAIDTLICVIDSNSLTRYSFTSLKPGKYIVKAALSKNSVYYKHHIPTYYQDVLKWDKAIIFDITGEAKTAIHTAYILLKKGNNPGGRGFIGGKVVAGANKKEGDPLENIQVMLFNANTTAIVANTFSDKNGNYSFPNLAFGKYEIYAEVPGIPTVSAFVTLSATDTMFNGVMVKVSSDIIITEVFTSFPEVFADISQISVYPNPAKNNLFIQLENEKAQALSTEIFSIDGRKLLTTKYNVAPGNQTLNLDIQQLPAGTYMLMLKNASSGQSIRYKFLKMR